MYTHLGRVFIYTDWSDPLSFYRFCKHKSLIYFCVQLLILIIWGKVFKKFYTCVKMTFVIQKLHLIASSCSRESYSQLNQHTMWTISRQQVKILIHFSIWSTMASIGASILPPSLISPWTPDFQKLELRCKDNEPTLFHQFVRWE